MGLVKRHRGGLNRLSLDQIRDFGGDWSGRTSAVDEAKAQVAIASGLIEMRKAGLLLRVHIEQSRVAIELPSEPDIKRAVSWRWAGDLVREFREREAKPKPAAGKPQIVRHHKQA